MDSLGVWRVGLFGSTRLAVGPVSAGPEYLLSEGVTIADALAGDGGLASLVSAPPAGPVPAEFQLLAPVDRQPVWAAGVTFERSRDGRLEESGGADIYSLVYEADRPELFFKSMPEAVRGPGAEITIRPDSAWNVPEPELGLVLDAAGRIAGYVLGDDVSSRSIEAANPLYLPQAKVYDGSCALGPCLVPVAGAPELSTIEIALDIERAGASVYADRVPLSRMRRTAQDLADWLFRALRFPAGAILLTGTSIVPTPEFSLSTEDIVRISATGLGVLTNTVSELPGPG